MSRKKTSLAAWAKEASAPGGLAQRLRAGVSRTLQAAPAPHVPPAAAPAMGGQKSLRDRLAATRRSQVPTTTGAHTPVPTPAPAAAPAPAVPAAAPPKTSGQLRAQMKSGPSDAATSVDPRIAQQTPEQARAAVHANNLINDAYRGQAVRSLGGAPASNPFARPVVSPPPEMLAAMNRGKAQASQWAAGHGSADAASQALRERSVMALPVGKRASEGSDGAVVRKMTYASIPICVETDVGQARRWTDPKSGEERATIMRFPYGYIPDTSGMDDGSVDVFVGPVSDAPNAYVILINKPPTFDVADEEKVFLGFTNLYDAIGAFLQHYGNQEKFIRKVSVVPTAELAKSLLKDGVTGTAEGSTKTPSHDSHPNKPKADDKPPVLEQDPTSSVLEALEDKPKPKIDEEAVKTAAAYLTSKIASAPPALRARAPRIDEEAVKTAAAYLTAKIAAEAALTSIPGFAPYNVTTETAEPEKGSVQDGVPDNTVYPDTTIDNLFRNLETNSMQTDHLVDPSEISRAV